MAQLKTSNYSVKLESIVSETWGFNASEYNMILYSAIYTYRHFIYTDE